MGFWLWKSGDIHSPSRQCLSLDLNYKARISHVKLSSAWKCKRNGLRILTWKFLITRNRSSWRYRQSKQTLRMFASPHMVSPEPISVFLHPFPHRHLEANSFITLLTNHKRTDMTKYCLVAQSCPTLLQPMDWSPPGSSVPGISQARILDWVAISLSRGSSRLRDQPSIICIFYTTGKFLDLLDMTKFLPKVCNQRCS